MKAMMRVFLLFLALAVLLTVSAAAEERTFTGFSVTETRAGKLAEGVDYSYYELLPPDGNVNHGQRISLIEVHGEALLNTRLLAVPGSPTRIHKGLKTLTTILDDVQAGTEGVILAGVNGDFFDMAWGGNVGNLKSEDEWLTAGEFPDGWACGMTAEGKPLIGQPQAEITLTMPDGEEVPIDALNAPRSDTPRMDCSPENVRTARKDNFLVLYTDAYSRATDTPGGGTEVILKPGGALTGKGILSAVVEKVAKQPKKGGTKIQNGRMVLSGAGDSAKLLRKLKAGDTVQLSISVQPPFDRAEIIIGGGRPDGGPLLMKDGELTDLEPMKAISDDVVYFYRHHPRTVFAIREDGSYFLLAVEGNRSGSFGMTLEEMQVLLTDLDAYTALNLDGGPSTTMAIRVNDRLKAVTDTTGGKGRLTPVGSALVLVTKPNQQ